MTGGQLELKLAPEPGSVAEARARLLDALAPQVARHQLDTLRLLVSELVTNAVRHGGARGPLRVRASWDGEIRVAVTDHGDGFVPSPRMAAPHEPGGFGLLLVGRLADRWGVDRHDATTVWFVLRRDGDPVLVL